MLFITNRKLDQGNLDIGGRVGFDIDNSESGQHAYFCVRNEKDVYYEIGSKAFFKELKECEAKQILIYIHGYSNLPEPHIFPRAEKLQKLFDQKEKDLVKVISLIWPCDNDFGALKDYWDDQRAADASAFAFGRVLGKFMGWTQNQENQKNSCMKRINVLAHSMGNRVLREAIKNWAKYDMGGQVPILFRNTFMAAADVVNETLEKGKSGNLITQCSRNVTVYHASDDLALRASKIMNLRNGIASRRLGHTGPEDMSKAPKNVFAVDCDDFNTKYDFPAGHAYFAESEDNAPGLISGKVFNHMYHAVKYGRVSMMNKDDKTLILG